MKKTLLTAIGLATALLASANGEMKDGWLIVEDFEASPAVTFHNFNGNGLKGVATIVDDPDGKTGKVLHVSGTEWQEIAAIEVTLPSGKTISDYTQIAFDYRSSKASWKNIKVMADDKEIFYSSNYGYATSAAKWVEFSTDIPEIVTTGNKIKLSFGVDCGEAVEFWYDNVRLLPKPDKVGETQNGKMIDDVTLMLEDFEACAPGAAYPMKGGSKSTIVENPKGTGLAVLVAGSNWESYPSVTVKMPEGKCLGNIKEVKYDLYIPTALEGQPSDPTFKMSQVAIDGETVYRDKDANGDDTYPNTGAGDKWATITIDPNAQGNITDAMKAKNEFTLAVGINDNKLTYYVDNIRVVLGDYSTQPENPDQPIDPSGYTLVNDVPYMLQSSPRKAHHTNRVRLAGIMGFQGASAKVTSFAIINPDAKISVYKDDEFLFSSSVRLTTSNRMVNIAEDPANIEMVNINGYNYYFGEGEFKMYLPANTIEVTLTDGSKVNNPAMYTYWTMKQMPEATETNPLDVNWILDEAVASDYNMYYYDLPTGKIYYTAYLVGWVDNDYKAHFDNENVPASYKANLWAHSLSETDPARCIWDTYLENTNLSKAYKSATYPHKNAWHEFYLFNTGSFSVQKVNSTGLQYIKGASFIQGSFKKANPADFQGIADIEADNDAPVEYYNLQGIRVAEPAPGQIVIRRQGSKVTKVIF